MTNKQLTIVLATLLAVIVGGGALFAIWSGTQAPAQAPATAATEPEELPYPEGGGTLILRVNPEFAIHYDADGVVVGVEALNADAENMGLDLSALEGQECRTAVSTLIARINEAGYFVEEVEGEGNTIDLEVEDGSSLPANDFLKNIVSDSQTCVIGQNKTASMQVTGSSNYGWTNYSDSDYGPENDGVTDYYDSDYGPLNDGVTDYQEPAPTAPPATSSGSSGGSSSGSSGGSGGSSGGSSGSASSGGSSGGGSSAPAPSGGNSNYGNSNYGGNSGYSSNSGYDSNNSGYDSGGNSNYDSDNSGYDD